MENTRLVFSVIYPNQSIATGKSKQSIWEKYTGQKKEHGQLLRWLQILGYEDTPKKSKVSPLSMMSEKKKKSPNILKTANSFWT